MSAIKVLIVEDEPLIARNIAMYLRNNDFEVSGIAHDPSDALYQLKWNSPDFAILDINLESDQDGIYVAEQINSQYFIPFIFLSSYSDRESLERAKKTKPFGYLVKPFNEKTLYTTIEIAMMNHAEQANRHVPSLAIDKLNQHLLAPLTDREFEVLSEMYAGKTNQQITESLFIAMNTLKKHINNAYFKLDVVSRTTALAKMRDLMLR
jgi:DNA-binding NarL/FixJ family response regulator